MNYSMIDDPRECLHLRQPKWANCNNHLFVAKTSNLWISSQLIIHNFSTIFGQHSQPYLVEHTFANLKILKNQFFPFCRCRHGWCLCAVGCLASYTHQYVRSRKTRAYVCGSRRLDYHHVPDQLYFIYDRHHHSLPLRKYWVLFLFIAHFILKRVVQFIWNDEIDKKNS